VNHNREAALQRLGKCSNLQKLDSGGIQESPIYAEQDPTNVLCGNGFRASRIYEWFHGDFVMQPVWQQNLLSCFQAGNRSS
jgi:hypothetical protein